ncbi:unnamed protein product [Symbiodinium necroappetens]|uniref:Uncharacterized protein n=1 Tax=Symbiodinium necroappetens TaxID=1628268 RepID=A0A812MX20_9DINO|nr:unnamed protein product [Symbiodinium necroappetens]
MSREANKTDPVNQNTTLSPRIPGGTEFYGAVPKHSATFAWSELCATPSPEDSLAPVPQIPMKTWYNSYVYVPEEGQQDRQYLQRFTRGPNGEWIDVVKARRLVDAMEERRQQQMREYMERARAPPELRERQRGFASVASSDFRTRMSGIEAGWGAIDVGFSALEGTPGSRSVGRAGMQAGDGSDIGHGVHQTLYTDAYSGERLIACKGKLQTRAEIFDEYHIRGQAVPEDEPFFDFDNLRFSWPFARQWRCEHVLTSNSLTHHIPSLYQLQVFRAPGRPGSRDSHNGSSIRELR